MIVSPDEPFSAREVANLLNRSERQVQRYLNSGQLNGTRINGRWQITALDLWKFQGIDREMQDLWVDYCVRLAKIDD